MSDNRKATFLSASESAASFVVLLVFVELGDQLLRHAYGATLDALGIQPRLRIGLAGVIFSPLLHGDWYHLVANAVPLLVLLTLLFWDRGYRAGWTLGLIWLVSGLGTWVIGRPGTLHVGASSLVYGLVAYLMAAGILMRSWRSVITAILVGAAFSGIWYGALPQVGPMSWEGHLCGAVAGVVAARWSH